MEVQGPMVGVREGLGVLAVEVGVQGGPVSHLVGVGLMRFCDVRARADCCPVSLWLSGAGSYSDLS